nr:MAG TPA: hypothetical protein [Bacteriophage sp.]
MIYLDTVRPNQSKWLNKITRSSHVVQRRCLTDITLIVRELYPRLFLHPF